MSKKRPKKNDGGSKWFGRIENPNVFPTYMYSGAPDNDIYDAEVKRGGPYFEAMKVSGFRVIRIPVGEGVQEVPIYKPWTFLFTHVPNTDAVMYVKSIAAAGCTVIMDCHFPIMQLERAMTPDDDIWLQVIESKAVMLANLAVACAVTVPHKEWAADLAEVNPRVWYLPDIEDADNVEQIAAFGMKFAEIAMSTQQQCVALMQSGLSHD